MTGGAVQGSTDGPARDTPTEDQILIDGLDRTLAVAFEFIRRHGLWDAYLADEMTLDTPTEQEGEARVTLYRCPECRLVRQSRSALNEAGCPGHRGEPYVPEARAEAAEALATPLHELVEAAAEYRVQAEVNPDDPDTDEVFGNRVDRALIAARAALDPVWEGEE